MKIKRIKKAAKRHIGKLASGAGGGLTVGIVLWGYHTFVALGTFKDFKQGQDRQNELLWKHIGNLETNNPKG
jgi:hypothetical protein